MNRNCCEVKNVFHIYQRYYKKTIDAIIWYLILTRFKNFENIYKCRYHHYYSLTIDCIE